MLWLSTPMTDRMCHICFVTGISSESPNKRDMSCVFMDQLESYGRMTLAKIPFILLGAWGINTTYTPPNPPPPQDERFPSFVPLDSGFKWAPIIVRVSNADHSYFSRKKTY